MNFNKDLIGGMAAPLGGISDVTNRAFGVDWHCLAADDNIFDEDLAAADAG